MKKRTEYTASARLLASAVAVDPFGHLDTALELGVLAAQLGLTVEDLEPMAKAYFALKVPGLTNTDLAMFRRVLDAVVRANRE